VLAEAAQEKLHPYTLIFIKVLKLVKHQQILVGGMP
jgi:hypothetical protein